uniref:DUF536 domain-containing protein n=1 Tax=Leuconostoc citreum TaxID=33964 RepID=A0A098DN39_LEUCI|nr:hypothetical protein [Leuconostoc citreum]CEF82713.1 Putative uncharacterized protein [Leuconostoc citreum]
MVNEYKDYVTGAQLAKKLHISTSRISQIIRQHPEISEQLIQKGNSKLISPSVADKIDSHITNRSITDDSVDEKSGTGPSINDNQIDELVKKKVDEFTKDIEANYISKEVAELNEKIAELTANNTQKDKQISGLEADKTNLQNTVNGLTQASVNFTSVYNEQKDTIKQLEAQIKQLEAPAVEDTDKQDNTSDNEQENYKQSKKWGLFGWFK